MVFDEIGQFNEECLLILTNHVIEGAKSEEFLELVENKHRRDRLPVPGVQMKAVVVEKFPERLVSLGQRGLRDACREDCISKRRLYLHDESTRRGLVIEADVNGEKAFGTQDREQTGAVSRKFSKS